MATHSKARAATATPATLKPESTKLETAPADGVADATEAAEAAELADDALEAEAAETVEAVEPVEAVAAVPVSTSVISSGSDISRWNAQEP